MRAKRIQPIRRCPFCSLPQYDNDSLMAVAGATDVQYEGHKERCRQLMREGK